MSLESAREFIEKLKSDNDFLNRINACKDSKERMAFAKSEGFEFTGEEIKDLKDELSSDDLLGTISQESSKSYDSALGHGWLVK